MRVIDAGPTGAVAARLPVKHDARNLGERRGPAAAEPEPGSPVHRPRGHEGTRDVA